MATPDLFTQTNTATTSGTTAAPTSSTFSLTGLKDSTDWSVDPKTQTVSGQLESILATDSPLMQQARTRATQAMNGRGLSNSSMAIGAADSAMYDAAMPIAQGNAAVYADAAKTNTGTKNAFSQQANSNAYDMQKTVQGQGFQAGQSALDRAQQTALVDKNIAADTASTAKKQEYNLANMAAQSGYDIAKIDKQTAAARDVADIEAQYKNLTQGSAAATSIVNKMQDSLTSLMNNKDITDQTKRDALALDIKRNAMESLNLVGAIAGDMDLSKFITEIGL